MGRIRLAASALAVLSLAALVLWLRADSPMVPSEAALELSAEDPLPASDNGSRTLPDSDHKPTQQGEQRASVETVPGLEVAVAKSSKVRSLVIVGEDGVTPRAAFAVRLLLGRRDPAGSQDSFVIDQNAALRTDAQGRLDVREARSKAPESPLLRCFPSVEMDLQVKPQELAWEDVSTDPLHPTRLTLSRRPVSPVQALVVNSATNEPLAFFPLRMKRWVNLAPNQTVESVYSKGFSVPFKYFSNPESEWVITDIEGRFTTKAAMPSGLVGFLTLEQTWVSLRWDATQPAQQRLEVGVGPRVLLDFTPGGGRTHEDYIAAVWRDPRQLMGEGGVREYPSPWSPNSEERLGEWGNAVSVQLDGSPYVQLTAEQAETPLPSSFLLLSRDGVSSGIVHVDSLDPYRDVPLNVPLVDRGQLTCRVVWPIGTEKSPRLPMLLESLAEDSTSSWEQRVYREGDAAQTTVQFQALDPGPYRLTITDEEYERASYEVQIPHPEELLVHPLPVASAALDKLKIQVLADSGQALDGKDGRALLARISVRATDGARQVAAGKLTWSEGVGSAEVELASPGSYQCTPIWRGGVLSTTPPVAIVQLPGAECVIRVHDTVPTVKARVVVVNPPDRGVLILLASLDGRVLMQERTYFNSEDGKAISVGEQTQRVFTSGPLRPDVQVSARLESEAHRLVELGDGAFTQPSGEERIRSLVIHSRPGFGARFTVWELRASKGEGRFRLPGVVLTLDGEAQAPTDERGQLMVSMDTPPTRLGVATPGWKLLTRTSYDDWGSVYADTGKFTLEDGLLDVFLEATGD